VATGWIYGPYHYTERLGPKFLGLVPWIIPAAWIMMIYPALVIADLIVPKFDKRVLRMILVGGVGGFAMTAWDLTMDPVMVLGQNWVWEKPGNYFGIPIQNYFGWFVTVLFILVIYQWLSAFFPKRSEEEEIPALWAVQSYGVTALSTVMIAFFINLTGPALVGIFAMLPWLAWGMWAAAAKRREYAGKG
jgi:putative membrane protein